MNLTEPVDILGVRVTPLTKPQLIELLAQWASADEKRLVSHANVHGLNLAQRDRRFREAINRADLVYCDGHGVKWGAAKLGYSIPERLAVMDWISGYAAALAERKLSLFLLGDEDGVAEQCADLLRSAHPGLRIAGTHHGFFDKTGAPSTEVVERVNASGADVLMVGFGMPTQEFWIEDHFESLEPKVILPVGAAFRWYAGVERRAPRWMINGGLEWLWRLAHHPLRMFRRYVLGNPLFVWRVHSQRRAMARLR